MLYALQRCTALFVQAPEGFMALVLNTDVNKKNGSGILATSTVFVLRIQMLAEHKHLSLQNKILTQQI
jgi:hypothetical protein